MIHSAKHRQQKAIKKAIGQKKYTYKVAAVTYNESELVTMLKNRVEVGYIYLYKQYGDSLLGSILEIIPDFDLASTVLQETFIKIYHNIHDYNETQGKLFPWTMRIAHNLAINMYRSSDFRLRQQSINSIMVFNNGPATSKNIGYIGLRKLCAKLKYKHWEVLELSYFKGFAPKEIASILGISIFTVKVRIKFGLLALRKLMEEA